MKKYLKQLRKELVVKLVGNIIQEELPFDEWDQNHIEFIGAEHEFHNVGIFLADHSVLSHYLYPPRGCHS